MQFEGPEDCYVDDGESYRGNVSETEKGHECLYWNSHFILENRADLLNSYDEEDGLGPHNFCRSVVGIYRKHAYGMRTPWRLIQCFE